MDLGRRCPATPPPMLTPRDETTGLGKGYRVVMGWLQKVSELVGRDRRMRERGEDDAPTDPAHGTREAGGVVQPGATDQNSTTGTTPNESYVGQPSGDETGDTDLSGSEARAGGAVEDDQGAGRDG
jgi:hypothetical protein